MKIVLYPKVPMHDIIWMLHLLGDKLDLMKMLSALNIKDLIIREPTRTCQLYSDDKRLEHLTLTYNVDIPL